MPSFRWSIDSRWSFHWLSMTFSMTMRSVSRRIASPSGPSSSSFSWYFFTSLLVDALFDLLAVELRERRDVDRHAELGQDVVGQPVEIPGVRLRSFRASGNR